MSPQGYASGRHRHKFTMVKPGHAWGCTQGEHNYIERAGFVQAVVMCYDADVGCAQGWCVDCIPDGAPGHTKRGPRDEE